MNRTFVSLGALLAFVAVVLGAFGAHILRERLGVSERDLATWQTGVQYHAMHAIALILVGLLAAHSSSRLLRTAGWLFVAGIAIFGGSLYVLVLAQQRWLGAVTPLGGLSFMAGWICLALGVRAER